MGRVAGVIDNPPGFPHAPPGVDVLEEGREGGREAHLQQCGGQFA